MIKKNLYPYIVMYDGIVMSIEINVCHIKCVFLLLLAKKALFRDYFTLFISCTISLNLYVVIIYRIMIKKSDYCKRFAL